MQFATSDQNCELFLTAQGVGFLMVTANGFVSRKWHGLTIEEHSILATLHWEFSHDEKTTPLLQHNWQSTQRDGGSITRHWKADCGCQLSECWDWSQPQKGLTISIKQIDKRMCAHQSKDRCSFRMRPLWTMEHAGTHTCATDQIKSGIKQFSAQKLSIKLEEIRGVIDFISLSEKPTDSGAWYHIEHPQQEWLPTHKDAARGEHHEREYFTTHEFRSILTAKTQVEFLLSYVQPDSPWMMSHSLPPTESPVWIETEKSDLECAYVNSVKSLGQLIQSRPDSTIGLQAGLPWFTQFWTRDLCHSFRAAFVWSNRTQEADELISQLWSRSQGKVIPNFTTAHATAENSIDALPLLLLSTADLVDRVGLTQNMETVLPQIKSRLSEAAKTFLSKKLIDHRDADTWMDAQRWTHSGQLIACSPRANRAFEIQAFWLAAIGRWSEIFQSTKQEFEKDLLQDALQQGLALVREKYFDKNSNRWADTLRPNGTPDFAIRPNVMLGFQALDRAELLDQLLHADELKSYLETLIETNLVTNYGVRTLSPETSVRHHIAINTVFNDESAYIHENKIHFHPYHEFGSRHGLEHPDWAYHNGTIWPWLSHPACQLFLRSELSDFAFPLINTLIHHSTQGSQGGALPELLDGLSSHSQWSWPKGAPHQAWSSSAFIHMIMENVLGLRIKNLGTQVQLNSTHWGYFQRIRTSVLTESGTISIEKDRNVLNVTFAPTTQESQIVVVHLDNRAPKRIERITMSHNQTQAKLNLMHK
jgi:glycogen debranching enzyme